MPVVFYYLISMKAVKYQYNKHDLYKMYNFLHNCFKINKFKFKGDLEKK